MYPVTERELKALELKWGENFQSFKLRRYHEIENKFPYWSTIQVEAYFNFLYL